MKKFKNILIVVVVLVVLYFLYKYKTKKNSTANGEQSSGGGGGSLGMPQVVVADVFPPVGETITAQDVVPNDVSTPIPQPIPETTNDVVAKVDNSEEIKTLQIKLNKLYIAKDRAEVLLRNDPNNTVILQTIHNLNVNIVAVRKKIVALGGSYL